jgi:putative endonuclease
MASTYQKTSKAKGNAGEDAAADFLEHTGFKILQRNYRYDRGEIDIVADDQGTIVFVEVKSRKPGSEETPEESITPKKEEFLKRTAEGYLFEHRQEEHPSRFDLVAVEWDKGKRVIRHLKGIFP